MEVPSAFQGVATAEFINMTEAERFEKALAARRAALAAGPQAVGQQVVGDFVEPIVTKQVTNIYTGGSTSHTEAVWASNPYGILG